MQVLPAQRQEKNCTGGYLNLLKNQNGKHLVNLYESNNLKTQVIFPRGSELARTLFPFESTNNMKIKVLHYRCIGDGSICEAISLMNTC